MSRLALLASAFAFRRGLSGKQVISRSSTAVELRSLNRALTRPSQGGLFSCFVAGGLCGRGRPPCEGGVFGGRGRRWQLWCCRSPLFTEGCPLQAVVFDRTLVLALAAGTPPVTA